MPNPTAEDPENIDPVTIQQTNASTSLKPLMQYLNSTYGFNLTRVVNQDMYRYQASRVSYAAHITPFDRANVNLGWVVIQIVNEDILFESLNTQSKYTLTYVVIVIVVASILAVIYAHTASMKLARLTTEITNLCEMKFSEVYEDKEIRNKSTLSDIANIQEAVRAMTINFAKSLKENKKVMHGSGTLVSAAKSPTSDYNKSSNSNLFK